MTSPGVVLAALCLALMTGAASNAQGTGATAPALALKGYDVVSYFEESRPVKGVPGYRQEWDGVRYHFSSAGHKATFTADPDRYAPQFASLCAIAVSRGKKVEADPEVWKIIDGKLYVFASTKAREIAEKDPAVLDRSHQNWTTLK